MCKEFLLYLFNWIFLGEVSLLAVFGVGLLFMVFASVFSCATKNISMFFAWFIMLLGGMYFALHYLSIQLKQAFPLFAALAIVCGGMYMVIFVLFRIRERKKLRKKEKNIQFRALEYSLPDRENTYIRERLNSALQSDYDNKIYNESVDEEIQFRFTYARKILLKLKSARLSAMERLETEEMENMLSLYRKKESYSIEDVRMINESFGRILKLAAKYSV